jgi:hypothetical protein
MNFRFITFVLLPVVLGIGSSALPEESTPFAAPTVAIEEPPSLLCFNESTKTLRTSDIVTDCSVWEISLGAGAIEPPRVRPSALLPELRARFLAAQAAAEDAGYPLVAVSGYRSYERQEYLFKRAVKKYGSESEASKWVLPPDVSHHPWGMAIDINYPTDPESTKWLEKNGYIYGLCRAYENEWWHFEALSDPGSQCPPKLVDASTTESR